MSIQVWRIHSNCSQMSYIGRVSSNGVGASPKRPQFPPQRKKGKERGSERREIEGDRTNLKHKDACYVRVYVQLPPLTKFWWNPDRSLLLSWSWVTRKNQCKEQKNGTACLSHAQGVTTAWTACIYYLHVCWFSEQTVYTLRWLTCGSYCNWVNNMTIEWEVKL